MRHEQYTTEHDEIGMKDFVRFFKDNGKLIALTAVFGLLLAVAYVKLAPKKYEVAMMLQMAQIGVASSIESPATLAERLRYPATYDASVLKECGFVASDSVGEYLGGMLKITISKALPAVLGMSVRALTPESANKCVKALHLMIVQQQRALIDERLLGKNEQLVEYQRALAVELRQLESIKKTEAASFGYLAKLDKLSWLRTRIDALQEEKVLAYLHPAKLVMPIVENPDPVSPRVKLSLLLGPLIGALMGVLWALGKIVWRSAKE